MSTNGKTLLALWAVAIIMLTAAFNFNYIYKKFCQITGYGGTTARAEVNDTMIIDRMVRVNFDANVDYKLNWEFEPEQNHVDVKLGQSGVAYYRATNLSDEPLVGSATFNVTPIKAAPYFTKTECFCFEEQLLQPGESVTMPVLFYVDPSLNEESRYDDVKNVTLSYKFFVVENPETVALSAPAAQGRDKLN